MILKDGYLLLHYVVEKVVIMKRIDKIYNYILTNSKKVTKDKLLEIKGFNAQEIEQSLDILKSNVCRELNILCRSKKIVKIKNRPVCYFDRKCFENILNIKLLTDVEEITDINDFSIICT